MSPDKILHRNPHEAPAADGNGHTPVDRELEHAEPDHLKTGRPHNYSNASDRSRSASRSSIMQSSQSISSQFSVKRFPLAYQ